SILPQDILKFYRIKTCPRRYVCHTVELLRELHRVLRKDGVLFWNLGDSYFSDAGKGGSGTYNGRNGAGEEYARAERRCGPSNRQSKIGNLKSKDLCLIPFRVALAAQADGWWVRSVIIWCLS